MTRTPRVAVVGAGLMGRWHATACRRAGGRVAAVVDADPLAATRLAAQSGAGVTARSLESLPAETELDLVHVCTPADTHVDQVRAALARGCFVIVEKPLAPTEALTEGLVAEAHRAGRWIQPVHQVAFQDGITRTARWVSGGLSGSIRAFDYVACSAGAEAATGKEDDIAAEILSHPLAVLDVLLPGALETARWDAHRPAAGEILATAVAGTTAVRLLISTHARPTRHELTLLADRGTVTADLFHGFAWRSSGPTSRARKITRPFASSAATALAAAANLGRRVLNREPAFPGLNRLVSRIYEALDDPDRRPLTDRHTLAVARARDQILQRVSHG